MRELVDKVVAAYEIYEPSGTFACRILLPRGEKMAAKAKRLGLAFQGEFILALRKKHLLPRVRDVRYVHDDCHYGWILASPDLYDRFLAGR